MFLFQREIPEAEGLGGGGGVCELLLCTLSISASSDRCRVEQLIIKKLHTYKLHSCVKTNNHVDSLIAICSHIFIHSCAKCR